MDLRDQLQATLTGSYTLERELGGGGMSRVFLAEELRLRRKVVIKVLSPELAQGISVERFEREIQTVAALQHANIVPVFTAGDTNGLPFYTMPFVEGESLRARLGQGPLAVGEVIGILRDVSKALAYAHQRGVVHRDIEPDNVLISGGVAVVTDFGIAKAISASRTSSGSATLTQVGTSIGTPAYMAPEQAAGDPDVDHRADIYSLGAMAYELLAGRVVFPDRTAQRMLAAHMSEAPAPITDFRPDLPAALAALVMQCLAKDANDRPQGAADIARTLETITSGSGMQAMPPVLLGGPGMFRKALAVYAGAFVAVAVLAKAAIVGIGLPDWVFPGALVVMALGLPVVLWTGYVQRVTRRAMAMTPTYTPGGTQASTHGAIATMALKAAPHVSWYRTARGGMYAFGAFIVMIAAFMAMRAFGIGPFGSLIATGALQSSNRVVIADFTATNGDSALGRVVAEAVRSGLNDSRVFTMLSAADVAAALQRMNRDSKVSLTLDLARQVALREGAKAVVDGSVTPVGSSYVVSARIVTADSARELVSYRATASSADAIIGVADELSRKLRAKAGESLRLVQGSSPLPYATTSSLEALRKYSEGARANDVERNFARAVPLLQEAVQLDSNFAEGWRKLGVAIRNRGGFAPSMLDSVLNRSFALVGRLNEHDRDLVLAYYYTYSPTHSDRGKAVTVYERMLARGDSSAGLNNIALLLGSRREFARAETLFRAAIVKSPGNALFQYNVLSTMAYQGKAPSVDSSIAASKKNFPGNSSFVLTEILMDRWDGRIELVRARYDSARKAGDKRAPNAPIVGAIDIAVAQGRFADERMLEVQRASIDSARGAPRPVALGLADEVWNRGEAGAPAENAIKALDAAIAATNFKSTALTDRPYLYFASSYAAAGRVDQARSFLSRYDAEVRDTALRRVALPDYQGAMALVAAREKRWNDAVDLFRKADRLQDGPVTGNPSIVVSNVIWVWALAGQADSSIAEYERYLKTPMGARKRQGPDVFIQAPITEALAKMYDAKGNTERAVALYRDFVELWKNADPELQPRVAEARKRLATLTPVEKARQ